MKNIKYRLYAAAYSEKALRVALDQPYARVTGDYVLLYKRGAAPDGFKQMTGEEIGYLSQADLKWLQETNIGIMELFVKEHVQEAERAGKKYLEDLRGELEAERKKLRGGDTA